MKLILIQTTFALPIWYRLSNPGEGWENGNQFNSQLENPQKDSSSDYRTATMGGFVPSYRNNLPSVGEPVESSEAPSDAKHEVQVTKDARIGIFASSPHHLGTNGQYRNPYSNGDLVSGGWWTTTNYNYPYDFSGWLFNSHFPYTRQYNPNDPNDPANQKPRNTAGFRQTQNAQNSLNQNGILSAISALEG